MEVDDELAEFGVVTSTTARAHWRGGRAAPTTPPRVHDAAPGNKNAETSYGADRFFIWEGARTRIMRSDPCRPILM